MNASVGTVKASAAAGLTAALLVAVSPAAGAGDYQTLVAPIAAASRAHRRVRLAVLPFQEIGGKGSTGGRIVSERLVGPLTGADGLEVVERTLLDGVMKEQKLQVSGVTDQRSIRELGRVLGVDAIVTGTVISLKDERVEVVARLIDAESARVLAVAETRVEKDWNESFFDDASWAEMPSLPNFDLAQNASASVGDCAAVDSLERSITDVKARYWAGRLRTGGQASALEHDPGAEIGNPDIRAEFYSKLRDYVRRGSADASPTELVRMRQTMEQISRQAGSCRWGGS